MAYRLLILTDHSTHTARNSFYSLMPALRAHPNCGRLDVASRALPQNRAFFQGHGEAALWASQATEGFAFSPEGRHFSQALENVPLAAYDFIVLRLPHPVAEGFFPFLTAHFPETHILNRPSGILRSGAKDFLLEVAELCPPIRLVRSVAEALAFAERFPIVLKPLRSHGGHGMMRIDGPQGWLGKTPMPTEALLGRLGAADFPLLGMKFLRRVDEGDKRIVVYDGQILGTSLRVPAPGDWLCNVAQGGESHHAPVEPNERHIAERLSELLTPMGVLLFGFDTLRDDDGLRKLSEINTMSVGAMMQMEKFAGAPIVSKVADAMWAYFGRAAQESGQAHKKNGPS